MINDVLTKEIIRFKIRKKTTPVHWIFGFLCTFLIFVFGFPAGWTLMGVFAGMEIWNDYCDGTREGCADWWESFLTFTIGQGILALLHCLGIITVI